MERKVVLLLILLLGSSVYSAAGGIYGCPFISSFSWSPGSIVGDWYQTSTASIGFDWNGWFPQSPDDHFFINMYPAPEKFSCVSPSVLAASLTCTAPHGMGIAIEGAEGNGGTQPIVIQTVAAVDYCNN